jgi:hypothetical protein
VITLKAAMYYHFKTGQRARDISIKISRFFGGAGCQGRPRRSSRPLTAGTPSHHRVGNEAKRSSVELRSIVAALLFSRSSPAVLARSWCANCEGHI